MDKSIRHDLIVFAVGALIALGGFIAFTQLNQHDSGSGGHSEVPTYDIQLDSYDGFFVYNVEVDSVNGGTMRFMADGQYVYVLVYDLSVYTNVLDFNPGHTELKIGVRETGRHDVKIEFV